ncbi:MAG: heme exporter protein CcmB [Acidobacteriota bacterium]
MSAASQAWAVCAKDVTQEMRRRIAIVAVFFFAATSLALVSYAIGPFGLPEEDRPALQAALLWIILFFAASTGLPRAFVREEETGTALALRKTVPASVVLAGKTMFNFLLFVAIAAVTVPGFWILLDWKVGSASGLATTILLGGLGLAVVSTFLSAIVSGAGQRNVLFVLIAFPLLLPLILTSITATLESTRGVFPWMALRVMIAYDGAAAGAAYMLAAAAWEE